MPDRMGMKGIYVLVVSVDEDIKVDVGALGNVDFGSFFFLLGFLSGF